MENLLISFLGACMGSYLGCAADRWGLGQNHKQLIFARSRCDHCQKPLAPFNLIPLFSWIFLRGKTRCCKMSLSTRHLFQEFFMAFIGGTTHLFYSSLPIGQYSCLQLASLVGAWIGFIDWRYHRLPVSGLFLLAAITFSYCFFYSLSPISSFLLILGVLVIVTALTFFWKNHVLPGGDWILMLLLGSWLPFETLPWFLTLTGFCGILTAFLTKDQSTQGKIFAFAPAIIFSWWAMMLTCSLP